MRDLSMDDFYSLYRVEFHKKDYLSRLFAEQEELGGQLIRAKILLSNGRIDGKPIDGVERFLIEKFVEALQKCKEIQDTVIIYEIYKEKARRNEE